MVRALLAGTKTQTRRVIKPQPTHFNPAGVPRRVRPEGGSSHVIRCPYGQPGDRLWVREAHSIGPGPGVPLQPAESAGALRWPHVTYSADGAIERRDMRWKGAFGVGRPSIHMPRWASRITLEITDVRVERLQDISEADARAEGVDYDPGEGGTFWVPGAGCTSDSAVDAYRKLFESINGPGPWDANPLVWAIHFRRVNG